MRKAQPQPAHLGETLDVIRRTLYAERVSALPIWLALNTKVRIFLHLQLLTSKSDWTS
jgi:hypothetical protein